jgi:ketosteroid isomerase-like protein
MNEQQAVRTAVDQWFVALNAMLSGNPKPLAKVYSHADDVTYLGAEGTFHVGWKATYDDWKAQAAMSVGGKARGEDIRVVVNGDMATAVHYTEGTLRQPGGLMARVRVRETSVFRKEHGA